MPGDRLAIANIELDDPAALLEIEMHAAVGDEDVIRLQDVAALGLFNREIGDRIEAICKRTGELSRHVLHDDNRRHRRRKGLENPCERWRSAGRNADRDAHARNVFLGRVLGSGGGDDFAGVGRGPRRAASLANLHDSRHIGSDRCANLANELVAKYGFGLFRVLGLGDVVHRPAIEAVERDVGRALGQAADHDHRHGPDGQYLFERGEAVHARHLDVKRDCVRIELTELDQGIVTIVGSADDGQVAAFVDRIGNHAPHQCGIIHDQHSFSCYGHGSLVSR